MPLVSRDDLLAPARSDANVRVIDRLIERVKGDAKPMPPPPNARLTEAEIATFDGWLQAGAPARGDAMCESGGGSSGGGSSGSPGDAGAGGGDASLGLSCAPDMLIAPPTPYTVPDTAANQYVCYGVDLQPSVDRHLVAITPRIDNTKVVHHVLLLQSDTAYGKTPRVCSPGQVNARMVYGWAPGGKAMTLPDDVGFALPASKPTHYIVQIHYNNASGAHGETDASGFSFCTDKPRAQEADVIAMGTQDLVVPPHGTLDKKCHLTVSAQLAGKHLIAAFPHMHQIGTAISTTLAPAAGGPTVDLGTVTNWDFANQPWYALDALTNVGDRIDTRCQYKNATDQEVHFGPNTEDEMCYSFTMYYPKIQGNYSWLTPSLSSTCD
jgi:hypothetical protein